MRGTIITTIVALAATAIAWAQVGATGVTEGNALIVRGRYREAISHFARLSEQYPNWAEAQLGLGLAHEKAGHKREAREAYERALKLDAREVRAMNNLGHLLIESDDDIPRAVKILTKAVEMRPDFSAAWDNLGWAHYKTKDYGRAVELFKRAVAIDPNNAAAQYHMGLGALRREDYARARGYFETVVRLDPRHVNGWVSLGLALQRMDKRSEAFSAYKQALALVNRKSVIGREVIRLINNLGSLYSSGGELLSSPEAIFQKYTPPEKTVLAPFSTMNPENLVERQPPTVLQTPVIRLSRDKRDRKNDLVAPGPVGLPRHMVEGRPGLADASVTAAITQASDSGTTPDSPPRNALGGSGFHVVRPGVSSGAQPPAAATGSFHPQATESMVKQDLVELHLHLARLYEQHGLYQEAVSEGQTVVNLAPWSKEAKEAKDLGTRLAQREEASVDQRIFGLMKVGQLLYSEHSIDPAILQYEKVLLLNPGHPIAYKNLAFLHLKAGRLDIAHEQAKKALSIEPSFLEALLIKGHIEARQRRFKDAYDTFYRLGELAREGTPIRQYAHGLAQRMRRFIELE